MNERSTSIESDDESPATDDRSPTIDDPIESLTDPEALRERDDVPFVAETDVLDRETFEAVRGQSEVGDGAAIVGVTNDDGEILLKHTCTGWLAPGGNVSADEDWAAVARREAESWTGVAVELDGVERVRRIDRRLEGSDSDEADDSETPDLPFYVVFFRASPAAGETPQVTPDEESDEASESGESDDEDAPEIEWFDAVPEGVDENHEDDVGAFFD